MSEVQGSSDTSVSSEGLSEVSNNQEAGAIPQAAEGLTKAQKEKFKLKVDGEEFEDEIDLNDKEELKRRFQLAHAAKKRISEANDAKKKAFDLAKKFETSEDDFLSKLPPDKARALAEKFLLAQIQDEMLSPEEKEFRDLRKYKESSESEKAAMKKRSEDEAAQKMENEYAQNFQDTIITALSKSGLPKSPDLVKRFAGVMKKNLELGLELTPDELVSEVKSEVTSLLKSIIGDADGDQLIKIFGDDVAKKIRKFDVKSLQDKQNQVFQKGKVTSHDGGSSQSDYETMEEWKERISRNLRN